LKARAAATLILLMASYSLTERLQIYDLRDFVACNFVRHSPARSEAVVVSSCCSFIHRAMSTLRHWEDGDCVSFHAQWSNSTEGLVLFNRDRISRKRGGFHSLSHWRVWWR